MSIVRKAYEKQYRLAMSEKRRSEAAELADNSYEMDELEAEVAQMEDEEYRALSEDY